MEGIILSTYNKAEKTTNGIEKKDVEKMWGFEKLVSTEEFENIYTMCMRYLYVRLREVK